MIRHFAFIVFCFLSLASCGQTKLTKLTEDYYFILTDNEVTKLHQSNDTLYELKCYSNKPCFERPKCHYKILNVEQKNEKIVFKLERLDTIQMTTNPYPQNRFCILVLRQESKDKILFVQQVLGLMKDDVTSNFIDTFKVENKFGFTYFSKTQYDKFSQLKTITSKKEVEFLIEKLKTEKFKLLAMQYEKSHPFDMYAAGLSAEILNQVCIDNGFNPIGAGETINKFMKE